uniref:PS II complex 12 kDa extrinsic protein n=1 Tax=Alexandrium andersonii TaxID=327968 RepID=A0A7S2C7C1_9DINO|mmetsp:Transcript_35108/g.79717  ORF Transcript_35108/g.79717 Transcript_35108/m.79717 type:complete len:117 (+) Transcript_35108:102-452(+)
MAFALRLALALAVLAMLGAAARDTTCNKEHMEQEMRLAEEEGMKYLERKRLEAEFGPQMIKGSSMLQVGTGTRVRKVKGFSPQGKVIDGVNMPSGRVGKYQFTPPNFNPYKPERVP